MGRLEDLLDANRLVLHDIEERIEGELIDSETTGNVVVEKGSRLERSRVRGPAIIGADSRIVDSYIGPYTAIDSGVTITGSEVERSIVLSGSTITNLGARMEGSLLGRDVSLTHQDGSPKTLRFLVGDHAEIGIP